MQSVYSCQSVFIVDLAALYHVDDDNVFGIYINNRNRNELVFKTCLLVHVTLLTCLITYKFLFLHVVVHCETFSATAAAKVTTQSISECVVGHSSK